MTTWHVTITGADDAIDPADLVRLSREFPFVEWGILFSAKRAGVSPRYPSLAWIDRLLSHHADLRLALHLCGSTARDKMKGRDPFPTTGFGRVQINGFDVHEAFLLERAEGHEVILQCRSEADLQGYATFIAARPNLRASILFDPSGGRGLEPARWPRAPLGVRMGYAGGIGPDNVLDVLAAIGPVEPTWIDMESGVRGDGDRFDLAKVRRVLETMAVVNGCEMARPTIRRRTAR
jgi:phosphoribosylanthranilate isomerase